MLEQLKRGGLSGHDGSLQHALWLLHGLALLEARGMGYEVRCGGGGGGG